MKLITTLLALSIFVSAGYPQTTDAPVKVDPFSTKDAVDASVKLVPCESEKRLDGVVNLFTSLGVPKADIAIEKFDKDKIQNVVVRKKGSTDETIVIGAHYDKVSAGCGVTDNWAGVVILAHIYKTLAKFDTKKSYVFVAFDKEEEGLKGSAQMVKAMTDAQRAAVCSMVNFDTFGQDIPMALANASSPKMLKLAEALGKESDFKFVSIPIVGASSDSASFVEKKIPAITISGIGKDTLEILHSPNDKLDKLKVDSIYYGYRFGVMYLAKLDAAQCGDFK